MKMLKVMLLAFVVVAVFPGAREAQCHSWHCHGSKVCGTWKYYRETDSAKASGADRKVACAAALDALDKKARDAAAATCKKKHKCGSCPGPCSGCKNERPFGRLGSAKKRKETVTNSDGGVSCSVEGEVVYICRCSPCVRKDKPKKHH